MVEFLTVFLGIALGEHAVELNVVGPVASVEIVLDGETLDTLTAAPWTFTCDLGTTPLPHELIAIARDAGGRELDRAEIWINLTPSLSATTLAIDTDPEGRARALSLDWQAIGVAEPEQIEATFDGRPLDVTDPEHVPLPSHDARDFHFVSAEVDFSDHETSRQETELGGVRSQKIATELTAVVVQLEGRLGLPSMAKMESWFVKDGQPLEVHGVEKGPMILFVVRGPGSQEVLDELAVTVLGKAFRPHTRTGFTTAERPMASPNAEWRPETFFAGEPEAVDERIRAHHYLLEPLRLFGPFDRRIGLRFVSTAAGPLAPAGLEPEMFVHSRTYAGSEGGLSWLAQKERPTRFASKTHEALTVAGMAARSENRRRAVLLITVPGGADFSEASTADVRDFLSALQVPLYVWSFGAADPAWADVVGLGDPGQPMKAADRLAKATAALQRDLKRQRVVWLTGRHLPNRIELGPEAKGIRLAGS